MKILRKLIGPVLLAAIILLAVRGLLVAHIQLPAYTNLSGLYPGQHAWVALTSYGLRVPGERWWGYHRWGYRMPQKGESLLFTLSANGNAAHAYPGICRALPGDTVWIDPNRQLILSGAVTSEAKPFIVPGRSHDVTVTPYNARLLCYIMRHYERCRVRIDQYNRLYLDGKLLRRVRLARDYYWVETLPHSYVLIPHDALKGKIIPMKKSKGQGKKE